MVSPPKLARTTSTLLFSEMSPPSSHHLRFSEPDTQQAFSKPITHMRRARRAGGTPIFMTRAPVEPRPFRGSTALNTMRHNLGSTWDREHRRKGNRQHRPPKVRCWNQASIASWWGNTRGRLHSGRSPREQAHHGPVPGIFCSCAISSRAHPAARLVLRRNYLVDDKR